MSVVSIEPYQSRSGETCGKRAPGVFPHWPIVAKLVGGGWRDEQGQIQGKWEIYLCKGCLDLELKTLSSGSPVNAGSETEVRGGDLKQLPILGIIPDVS